MDPAAWRELQLERSRQSRKGDIRMMDIDEIMAGVEYRRAELRAEGKRTLAGVAVRYGDRADIMGIFTEEVARGALSFDGVTMNVQHRRELIVARTGAGLTLTDGEDSLDFRADLPRTRRADELLDDVRAGLYRGASMEFRIEDSRWDGDHRIVTRAHLRAVAVVDTPAYPDSAVAEMRALMDNRGAARGGSIKAGVLPASRCPPRAATRRFA